MSQQTQDHGPEYRHIDDMEWETLRFPGQESKMLFHPRPERSSEPNTGFAPFILAICRPIRPTPELAPWISTLSPSFSRPCVTSALCSVCSAGRST